MKYTSVKLTEDQAEALRHAIDETIWRHAVHGETNRNQAEVNFLFRIREKLAKAKTV